MEDGYVDERIAKKVLEGLKELVSYGNMMNGDLKETGTNDLNVLHLKIIDLN